MEVIIDPNRFAYLMLAAWPVVTFLMFRRLPKADAIIWSVVGGMLVLPALVVIPLPGLPEPHKHNWPIIICFFILLYMTFKERGQAKAEFLATGRTLPQLNPDGSKSFPVLPGWLPRKFNLLLICAVGLAVPAGTYITNTEPIVIADSFRIALEPMDVFRGFMRAAYVIIPILVGRKFLAHPDAHLTFLRIIFWAAIAYTPLILWEWRLSPQLHRDIYGFLPQHWVQLLRGDGYRPLVFFQHGLKLAMFIAMAVIAGIGYWKAVDRNRKGFALPAVVYLGVVLTMLNSLGALLIAIVFCPIAIFLFRRGQLMIAAMLALLLLSYPTVRSGNMLPLDTVVEQLSQFENGRSGSLGYRFYNEDILLEHGNEKPLFGWGRYSRHRVYNEDGVDVSVTDGLWIIVYNQMGLLGYLSFYGLLCLPVIFLMFKGPKFGIPLSTACLALVLSVNLLDLIPNASLFGLTWLIAGALWGRLELGPLGANQTNEDALDPDGAVADGPPVRTGPKRTRFGDPDSPVVARTRGTGSSRIVRRQPGSRIVRRNGKPHPGLLPRKPT